MAHTARVGRRVLGVPGGRDGTAWVSAGSGCGGGDAAGAVRAWRRVAGDHGSGAGREARGRRWSGPTSQGRSS